MIRIFLVTGQVFGRDDQLDHAALGVGGRQGQEDLVGHGDGLGLAGIDHRQAQVAGGRQGRGDAGDLGGQHLGGAQIGETGGQFLPAGIHQPGSTWWLCRCARDAPHRAQPEERPVRRLR